ncbi:MAG: hypothetical protein ACREJV_03130 [Candidatus Rokuibacteriota bacterium]
MIEIGTATGLSALAMRQHLPAGGRLSTFDSRAWGSFADTCLRPEDFADGSLAQIRWNMLAIWREIRMPKLDVTSFGHWSGTGLVEWTEPSGTPPDRAAGGADKAAR